MAPKVSMQSSTFGVPEQGGGGGAPQGQHAQQHPWRSAFTNCLLNWAELYGPLSICSAIHSVLGSELSIHLEAESLLPQQDGIQFTLSSFRYCIDTSIAHYASTARVEVMASIQHLMFLPVWKITQS